MLRRPRLPSGGNGINRRVDRLRCSRRVQKTGRALAELDRITFKRPRKMVAPAPTCKYIAGALQRGAGAVWPMTLKDF